MTTYYIPLLAGAAKRGARASTAVAKLEVFDIVLLTDHDSERRLATIEHSLVLRAASSGAAEFVLELRFPPFNGSLTYDPSLGVGVLLGSERGGDSSGGGDSSALVIGVAVALPIAAVVVASAIGAAAAVGWRRRRKEKQMSARGPRAVNFHYLDNSSGESGCTPDNSV
jgi:hypothetical protein